MPRGLIIAVAILLTAVLALGISVLYFKREAEQQQKQAQEPPIAPPVAQAATQVTLVLANDSDGSLSGSLVSISLPQDPASRPTMILHALVAKYLEPASAHPLGPGSDVNNVYAAGGNLAVIDVNSAFVEGHRSGILIEELTLASMAQTLAANVPGITRIKLLVDGKERPTLAGHADLAVPYDLSFDARRAQIVK